MRIAFTHNVMRHATEEEAEFDTPSTIAAIIGSLERLGHVVEPIDVAGDVADLVRRLNRFSPELVFNTAEGSIGRTREAFYPGLFEQLGFPHTGSDAFACTLTLDKRLSKLIVSQYGVPTPRSVFVEELGAEVSGLRMPVIVKPNFEGSSKGIESDAVVRDAALLEAKIAETLARFPAGVLVEEFIEGHDVTVPFLEGVSPQTGGVLPAAEYVVKGWATSSGIYDYHLKTEASDDVTVRVPAELDDETASAIVGYTQLVHRALGVRDAARTDFRIDHEGRPWFLEINALPSLEPGASLYVSAELAGIGGVDEVIGAIVASACRRLDKQTPARTPVKSKLRVGLVFNLKRVKGQAGGENDHEAEYDSPETVDAIVRAIEAGGHEVVRVEARAQSLSDLDALKLDAAFNIAEGVRGRSREALVPALLELHGVPYTGSDAATMAVALDKGLSKRVAREAGVPTPDFVLMQTGKEKIPAGASWPMIVKPVAEGSSKGVLGPSVVYDEASLREAARKCIERYRQPALAEAYLPGREFTVGLLGNKRLEVLPIMEIVFGEKAGKDPVYSFDHKLEMGDAVRYVCPAELEPALEASIKKVARDAFWALGCRDVARIDVRLDAEGRPCFIECNPLPGLTPGWSDLCLIAEAGGVSYEKLIKRILAPALRRRRLGDL